MGTALGAGTNNLGELWALGIALWCILETAKPMHSAAYIFTDSNYAIGVATGKWKGKHPLIDKLTEGPNSEGKKHRVAAAVSFY